jgi:hypothetical protein
MSETTFCTTNVVTILMKPAFSANPRLPLATPATNADAAPATSGRKGWHPGRALQMAVAANWTMAPQCRLMKLPMALKMGFQKHPRKQ